MNSEVVTKLEKNIRFSSDNFDKMTLIRLKLVVQHLRNCELLIDEVDSLYQGERTESEFQYLFDNITSGL